MGKGTTEKPVWIDGKGWICWHAGRELRWTGSAWRAIGSEGDAGEPSVEPGPTSVPSVDNARRQPQAAPHLIGSGPQLSSSGAPAAFAASLVAMAAALMVATAALLPFIQPENFLLAGDIKPGARVTSFMFGIALLCGAGFLNVERVRVVAGALTAATAGTGAFGYVSFAVIVMRGIEQEGLLGPTVVQYSPGIGLGLSVLGSMVCAVACIVGCVVTSDGQGGDVRPRVELPIVSTPARKPHEGLGGHTGPLGSPQQTQELS